MVFKMRIANGGNKYLGCIIRRGTGSMFRILDYNPVTREYLRSWDSSTDKYPQRSHFVVSFDGLKEMITSGKWRIIDVEEETRVLKEKEES